MHRDRAEAIRRGHEGFEFFGYAVNALVAQDTVPGRTNLWGDYLQAARRPHRGGDRRDRRRVGANSSGIGTPDDMRTHLAGFSGSGVDQVIFLQQAGRNRHEHICEALELFAAEVMPAFKAEAPAREARKAEELAPYIAAALKRKRWMKPLADRRDPGGPGRCRRGSSSRPAWHMSAARRGTRFSTPTGAYRGDSPCRLSMSAPVAWRNPQLERDAVAVSGKTRGRLVGQAIAHHSEQLSIEGGILPTTAPGGPAAHVLGH